MSAPSKLSSTPSPLTIAAGSAEATRKSAVGPPGDGAGSIAERGNSSGWEDCLELLIWGSVAAGKCALRSAPRIGATGSRWAVVPNCLSAAEQPSKEHPTHPLHKSAACGGATYSAALQPAPPPPDYLLKSKADSGERSAARLEASP